MGLEAVASRPANFSTLLQARRLFSLRDECREAATSPDMKHQLREDEKNAFRNALQRRTPQQLLDFRQDFASTEEGNKAYIAAATEICGCVTARIDEKTQICGEIGRTTIDFLTPEGDKEMIVACGEEHARRISIDLALTYSDRDEPLINEGLSLPSPILGRNGFRKRGIQR